MGWYHEKIAEKNKLDYMKTKRIYLDDYSTYLETSGTNKWRLVAGSAEISVNDDGSIKYSGDVRFSGNSNFKSVSSNALYLDNTDGIKFNANNSKIADKGSVFTSDTMVSSAIGYQKVTLSDGTVGYVPVYELTSLQ